MEYLPFSISYDALLISFIAMVPCTYVGYILAGVLHRLFLDRDLKRWRSGDLSPRYIKVKSKDKLVKLHGHVAKVLSEIILIAFSLILVLVMDPLMCLFLFLLMMINIRAFVERAFYKGEHDRIGFFKLHRRQYIEYFSSVNFIFVFVVLVGQIKLMDIGVFEALFVLLMSRMLFQAVQRFSFENIYISSHLSG
ncbi:hypothetical protein [Halomonas getboli]|uniref:hypothetical protein n=1 Tax=Halomonas getboli TaxID=2935862 RepID=UPI001FFFAED0|nr:hypothetical protein [Halomonas getboli]MCK2183034.1 hypothetical protein [Halomonas getboli]